VERQKWVIGVAFTTAGQRPLDPSYRAMSAAQRTRAACH
jgi:hypothetical protein